MTHLSLPDRLGPRMAPSLRWQRALIIAGVLLLSAVLAHRSSIQGGRLLFALVPALALAGLFLRRPALGLLALIPANMVIPLAVNTGTATDLNGTALLLGLLAVLWLFDMVALQRRIWLHRSRPILPLVALALVSVIAFLNGQLSWFIATSAPITAQAGALAIFLLSAIAFLLAAHRIRELRGLQWIVGLFFALSALYLVGRLVPEWQRPIGRLFLWGATASQFWTWLVALLAGQLLFNRGLSRSVRLALGLLLLAALYAALGQSYDWKSGWLPPLISLAALLALRSWRLALGLVLGGLFLLPWLFAQLITVEEYSYSTRLDAWLIMLDIIKVNPILGLGLANYYWYTPLYTIRGYAVEFNSHNQYVDLVAQTGLVGLLLYLWFFWEMARLGWRLRDRVPAGFARGYVYGALGGIAGSLFAGMLGDWVLPFVYNVGLVGLRSSILCWLFLGALVAIEQMAPARGAAVQQPP